MINKMQVKRWNAFLLLGTVVLFIITGYGMTKFQIMEKITGGLLTKPLAFKIHTHLIFFLVIFLLIHLYYSSSLINRFRRKWKQ